MGRAVLRPVLPGPDAIGLKAIGLIIKLAATSASCNVDAATDWE
jgi:hypothetical protein